MFGLFESRKVTSVATSVSRVIPDSALPDAMMTGVAKAVMESGDFTDYALEELIGSIGMRAERMYEYAARAYTYGLPSGQYRQAIQGKTQIDQILDEIEGTSVIPEYSHYGPPNSLHIAWMQIIAQYGYSQETNQLPVLSALKGSTVYLDDMQVCVPDELLSTFSPTALAQWGVSARSGATMERAYSRLRSHSPVFTDLLATDDYIKVTYVWGNAANPQRESVVIPLIPAYGDNLLSYFHAKYTVNGVTKYWMYQAGLGTWPELDALFNVGFETNGTYFPFLYFRFNGQSDLTNTTSPAYITSAKMAKLLGMDYATVGEGINNNPGIADVKQAIMVMSVPANTQNALELQYLFSYFDAQYILNPVAETTSLAQLLSVQTGEEFVYVADAHTTATAIGDKRFHMVLSNNGIVRQQVAGTIGAIGTYTGATTTQYISVITGTGKNTQTYSFPVQQHIYRRQVSVGIYEQITVNGLNLRYYMDEGYSTLASGNVANLLIPIDRSITSQFNIREKETLYSRSLHYVINSMQTQTVEWYQDTWFQTLLLAVAIVVTVMSFGEDGGQLITAVLAMDTAAIAAASWAIFIKVVIGIVVGAVFKVFVRAIGAEAALWAAIIAGAIAVSTGRGDLILSGPLKGVPWADTLLQVATGISQGIQAITSDALASLKEEYDSLEIFKNKAEKQLEAANKLLEHRSYLEPIVIFGETPNDFYNRSTHSGNIGVLGLSAISSYVDIALQLPKLNETIGNVYATE